MLFRYWMTISLKYVRIVLRSFSQLEKMTQEIQELDASYLGANTPGLELAQMKHETQVFRLFMS